MSFKKMSKMTLLFTSLLTLVLCFSATAVGAYKGQAVKEAKSFESNRILYEKNTYFIFAKNAKKSERPSISFVGGIGITYVKKNGYTSLGSYKDLKVLADDISKDCERRIKQKDLTEQEAKEVIAAVKEIISGKYKGNVEIKDKDKKTEVSYEKEYDKWGIQKKREY